MARFVAKYARYARGVRPGREMVLADGQRQVLQKELFVQFQPNGMLTEDEIRFGVENLQHHGLPIDRNTEMHFSPRSRLSGFDTEQAQQALGWTDEEREYVEEALRSGSEYGMEYVEIPATPLSKPWATYDTTDVKKIVSIAEAMGLPLADVLAYEKANANRPAVLLLIEDALSVAEAPPEAPVVIEA